MTRIAKASIFSFLVVTFTGILVPLSVQSNNGAPSILHDISGREECLSCHAANGLSPVPPSHSGYDQDSCLICHSAAADALDTSETPGTATSEESCQQCHSQAGLNMILPNGQELSLYVDPQEYAASVHGGKLLCTDCHSDITSYPHPTRAVNSRREYNIAQYELCKKCHFDNYTKTLDSIHYQVLAEGNLWAPLCTDCHGAHDVALPSQPRAQISQTCSRCHQNVYEDYIDSVHGEALLQENNYDVPVCTDCHRSHIIEDPRTASFRLESVHLCSNCHSNEEIMSKYGISSNVVKTYLSDFHGRTVALLEKRSRDIWVEEAVCTDCHGIHDIQVVDSPNSPVIKSNLVTTCRKCHPDANANFSGAWLSHYEPSISKTPLIFTVRWFYWILIPFMLAGLSVHILLDLWRKITNR